MTHFDDVGVPRAPVRLSDAVISAMGYDSFCAGRHAVLASSRGQARNTVTADRFYVFGLLAERRVDLIVSDRFTPHNSAALGVIIHNAGGIRSTRWASHSA